MKNGYDIFRLEILEYCEKSLILEREQYYLDILKPRYNICKVAGSTLGRVTKNSTRLKLKLAWLIRLFRVKNNTFLDQMTFSVFVLT